MLGSWPTAATPALAQEIAPSTRATTAPRALLSVPYLPQEEDLCGGAAAAMVRRYWGDRAATADEYRDLVDRSAGGIHTATLVGALRAQGWQAVPLSGSAATLASLLDEGRPVIALIEIAPTRYHYVVVLGVGPDHVVYHDPAEAPFRVARLAEFEQMWRPTSHWAMVVAPDAPEREARSAAWPATAGAIGTRDSVGTASGPLGPLPAGRSSGSAIPCATAIERGQVLAADGLLEDAASEFQRAVTQCPASALGHRELAGVRFREARWEQAAALASDATRLDPNDPHAWRLRGASLYLSDRRSEALAAWNQIAEPTVDLLRAPGLDDLRFEVARAAIGLRRGDLLTPTRLQLARRRLDELPTAARANLRYEPTGEGRTDMEIGLLERRSSRLDAPTAARAVVDAATERRVSAFLVPGNGRGELLTLRWRWQAGRPQVLLRGDAPRALGLPGVLSVEGLWQAEDHAAATGGAGGKKRETLRQGGLVWTDWLAPATRVALGVSIDRWSDRETGLAITVEVQQRLRAEHAAVRATGSRSVSFGDDGPFSTWSLQGLWRSTTAADRPVLEARAGVHEVGRRAPRTLWPGAGTGLGRTALLRAHPVFDQGVVLTSGIGRLMVHGGLEARLLPWRLAPVSLGPAVFVDWAYLARQQGERDAGFRTDAGLGLRAAVAGLPGHLRLDLAAGLTDSAWALSLGWQHAWPDW